MKHRVNNNHVITNFRRNALVKKMQIA